MGKGGRGDGALGWFEDTPGTDLDVDWVLEVLGGEVTRVSPDSGFWHSQQGRFTQGGREWGLCALGEEQAWDMLRLGFREIPE